VNPYVDFRKKDMPDQFGGKPHGKRKEYWPPILIENE
jgi:hypothetical protein